MSRTFLAAACLLAAPLVAQAALDPELTSPYRLDVVLRVADHRQLTREFKDQVQNELQDSLQGSFGALARVRVFQPTPQEYPRLREVLDKGLESAMDSWGVSDGKTHFVLVDFVNGQYRIRARQHDGYTGQPTPLVRDERTPDRQYVARIAALMVDRDFGLVATVTDKVSEAEVRVGIKGGGLGVPLDRWLRKDELFSVVQLLPAAGGLRGNRVQYAFLRVKEVPQNGVCPCGLFRRYKDPLGETTGAVGARGIKLSTINGRLRIRFVQKEGKAGVLSAPPTLQVAVRRYGFEGDETDLVQETTDADGFMDTKKAYAHAAFVTVQQGPKVLARIPVEMLQEMTIRVSVDAREEEGTPILIRKNLWLLGVYDSVVMQAELSKELRERVKQPDKNAATLDRARQAMRDLDRNLKSITAQQQALLADAQGVPNFSLSEADQPLGELRLRQGQLQTFIANLEGAVKEENDPKRKELRSRLEQARLLEDDADYGKAITLYEEVLAEGLEVSGLRERLDTLKKGWELKDNDKHPAARKYIYDVWPSADLVKDTDAVRRATEAFETCKERGDRYAPAKLLKEAIKHIGGLQKTIGTLHPDVNEEDLKTVETLKKAAGELQKLVQEVSQYLGAK